MVDVVRLELAHPARHAGHADRIERSVRAFEKRDVFLAERKHVVAHLILEMLHERSREERARDFRLQGERFGDRVRLEEVVGREDAQRAAEFSPVGRRVEIVEAGQHLRRIRTAVQMALGGLHSVLEGQVIGGTRGQTAFRRNVEGHARTFVQGEKSLQIIASERFHGWSFSEVGDGASNPSTEGVARRLRAVVARLSRVGCRHGVPASNPQRRIGGKFLPIARMNASCSGWLSTA